MAKRSRMSKKGSRKSFAKGARVNRKNNSGSPMRGGIRL